MNMQNDIQGEAFDIPEGAEAPEEMKLRDFVRRSKCNTVSFQEMIGVTSPTFSKYMSGTRTPDAETAVLIHKVTKGRVPVWIWPRYAAFKEFLSDG